MTKVLVSACLLGHPCRWHGRAVPMSKYVLRYRQEHPGVEFVPVCPEQLGGLPTPRPAVKWVKGRIFQTCPEKERRHAVTGKEVTAAFQAGADSYVNKPFNWDQVLSHIRKLLPPE